MAIATGSATRIWGRLRRAISPPAPLAYGALRRRGYLPLRWSTFQPAWVVHFSTGLDIRNPGLDPRPIRLANELTLSPFCAPPAPTATARREHARDWETDRHLRSLGPSSFRRVEATRAEGHM